MSTFPMPTPHVNCQLSSVILRVFSIVRRGNWVGSVALDLICGRCLFPCTPRQVQLSSSFLSTCNWRSPKSDWAVPVTLTKKRWKVSKTWWSEWIIGWHKLEQEAGGNTSFTALMRRLLTAKRQLSRVTFHVSPVAGSCRVATGCLLDNLASSPIHPGDGSIYLFYQVLSFENDPWAGICQAL